MRQHFNPQSNEDNGFIRLAQTCRRCAYISEVGEAELADLICLRHPQFLTTKEADTFTCDYFF